MTNVLSAVSCLLCLQELLAPVLIGIKVLLIGESDLFLDFYEPMEAICAVQRLQKPLFYLFLPTILAASPMDMCAKNSCIDSVGEIRGI